MQGTVGGSPWPTVRDVAPTEIWLLDVRGMAVDEEEGVDKGATAHDLLLWLRSSSSCSGFFAYVTRVSSMLLTVREDAPAARSPEVDARNEPPLLALALKECSW
eukprot:GHVU01063475.1.p2 GENE.GHVU01063475.1~~GHVU01063475.1.p2  ORF type:complete len:104 (-),score=11.47 GHVU01063475.1:126-437(-)